MDRKKHKLHPNNNNKISISSISYMRKQLNQLIVKIEVTNNSSKNYYQRQFSKAAHQRYLSFGNNLFYYTPY